MKPIQVVLFVAVGLSLAVGGSCKKGDKKGADQQGEQPAGGQAGAGEDKPSEPTFTKGDLGAFAALPANLHGDQAPSDELVNLGRMLYFDARLSKNQDISCNSCHQLDRFGVDGEPTSPGHKEQRGSRNSPTSYNAAGHIAQFWDGRAADVEEQAKGPILNPIEMATPDEKALLKVLTSIPGYKDAFKAAFPAAKDAITYDNLAIAIGAFERGLVTPGRWDKFLGGDQSALSAGEKAGLRVFLDVGCATCHSGPYMGGHMYQKLGAAKPWPKSEDTGRFEVTKKDEDKFMFKVPSLRNIAETGPYFHDGSVAELDQAIGMMAEYQLGKSLTPDQIAAIGTFLNAMTGEVPTEYVAKPELPESGPKTPAPDPS